MVIWITGLSGAGKTTLSSAFYRLLKPRVPQLVLLDGDQIRKAFGNDLGYSEKDRWAQVRRLQNLTKILSDEGLIVLVAVLYAHPDLLRWNRENFSEYLEVYLSVPLKLVEARDEKGIYAKGKTGLMKDIVGMDIPWNAPENPDFRFEVDYKTPPEKVVLEILAGVPRLAALLEKGNHP